MTKMSSGCHMMSLQLCVQRTTKEGASQLVPLNRSTLILLSIYMVDYFLLDVTDFNVQYDRAADSCSFP